MTSLWRLPATVVGLIAAIWCGPALANSVDYSDYVAHVALTFDGVSYPCVNVSDATCAFVAISATGDTNTIQPFSVPGASGFKNSVHAAEVQVFFNNDTPFSVDLADGQIFVSVDQTNGGAGFGSSFGPTYPAATYGGGADYAHYDLASDFYAQGFAPFCPDVQLCQNGAALKSTTGKDLIITYPFAPIFSIFSSTVSASVPVPEPGSAGLFMFALGLLVAGRHRRLSD